MMKEYDITIVGAGVVGSALALHLAQLSYRVLLLDMYHPPFESSNPERVVALSEGSVNYLAKLGAWSEDLQKKTGLIQHISVSEPVNEGEVLMSHETLADADALGYVVEIKDVLQAIHQQFAPEIDTIYEASLDFFSQDEAGVDLKVQTPFCEQSIHTSLLIGADGTQSTVRKLAGVQCYGWDHNRVGIVASASSDKGHQHTAYECFKQDGPLALLPLADGRFSIVWSVSPKTAMELMALTDEGFLHMLRHDAGEYVMEKIGTFTDVSPRVCFPLELLVAKHFVEENVFLMGNAAHTVHPIAGQGMNLGLRDVADFTKIIEESWARENLMNPLIGETYAQMRRADTLKVVGFTETMLTAFASSLLPMKWLRSKGLKHLEVRSSLKQILLENAAGVAKHQGLKS